MDVEPTETLEEFGDKLMKTFGVTREQLQAINIAEGRRPDQSRWAAHVEMSQKFFDEVLRPRYEEAVRAAKEELIARDEATQRRFLQGLKDSGIPVFDHCVDTSATAAKILKERT